MIKDPAGPCDVTFDVTVNEPDALIITSDTATDISCIGLTDGTVTVVTSGGNPGLTYSILPANAPDNATGLFTGLTPASYVVTVTDPKGCTPVVTGALVVDQPKPLTVTIDSSLITCHGDAIGYIKVKAIGGAKPHLRFSIHGDVPGNYGNRS